MVIVDLSDTKKTTIVFEILNPPIS